jgi:protein required for attachment to host cells
MAHRRKLIFLLADGAHARFVEQTPETGAYVTVRSMDGSERIETLRAEQRDEAPGRTHESFGYGSHAVGREDAYRRAKAAFAADVAKTLNHMLAQGDFDGVVLVAPARLRKTLRAGMTSRTAVVRELAKDLTKTPDHELGGWLNPLALAQAR